MNCSCVCARNSATLCHDLGQVGHDNRQSYILPWFILLNAVWSIPAMRHAMQCIFMRSSKWIVQIVRFTLSLAPGIFSTVYILLNDIINIVTSTIDISSQCISFTYVHYVYLFYILNEYDSDLQSFMILTQIQVSLHPRGSRWSCSSEASRKKKIFIFFDIWRNQDTSIKYKSRVFVWALCWFFFQDRLLLKDPGSNINTSWVFLRSDFRLP